MMIDFMSFEWPQWTAAILVTLILASNILFHGQALRITDRLAINFHAPYASIWISIWFIIAYADGFFGGV